MTGREIGRVLSRLADEIPQEMGKDFVIVGIKRRGAVLAERLKACLAKKGLSDVPLGFLDITLYRDDFSEVGHNPVVSGTEILFDLDDRKILLIDDVMFTGRTIRAALDQLMDYGRPKLIRFFALVDRNGRELPIQPDLIGIKAVVGESQVVEVRLKEVDGRDEVVIAGKT